MYAFDRLLLLLLLSVFGLFATSGALPYGTPPLTDHLAPPSGDANSYHHHHHHHDNDAIANNDTALVPRSPWTLYGLTNARGRSNIASGLGLWEEVRVAVSVKRWVDENGQRVPSCKGWKDDGKAFWWTMWWDLWRLWRELMGEEVCEKGEEVPEEGDGKAEVGREGPEDGVGNPVDGA
ncbi:hypothetical protein MMC26_002265 [Xylographa opegraphella]|nr:hypothetical protein [Xylographa opegraphella]